MTAISRAKGRSFRQAIGYATRVTDGTRMNQIHNHVVKTQPKDERHRIDCLACATGSA